MRNPELLNSSASPQKQADPSSAYRRCTKSLITLPEHFLPTTSIANSCLACSRMREHRAEHLPMLVCFIQDLSACLKDCEAALQCPLLLMYQHCVLITREQNVCFNRVLFLQCYPQPLLASSNVMILSCVQIFVQRLFPPTFPHH